MATVFFSYYSFITPTGSITHTKNCTMHQTYTDT